MGDYKKLLTVQDISCVGQCSLTVALPIISVCGIETCVLPSAVLSTHTGGFTGYTFRDLSEDIPKICEHWQREDIRFDAIYTGYLGSARQIKYVEDIFDTASKADTVIVVDPAMADNGKLYAGFDAETVTSMKGLCRKADFVLPNITEACLLTDTEYKTEYGEDYIDDLLNGLLKMGCKNIVLTGVTYSSGEIGIAVCEEGRTSYYRHELLPVSCHGTGDIFASVFVGAYIKGKAALEAAGIAAEYVLECIKATAEEENHWYGVKFEPSLHKLSEMLK